MTPAGGKYTKGGRWAGKCEGCARDQACDPSCSICIPDLDKVAMIMKLAHDTGLRRMTNVLSKILFYQVCFKRAHYIAFFTGTFVFH